MCIIITCKEDSKKAIVWYMTDEQSHASISQTVNNAANMPGIGGDKRLSSIEMEFNLTSQQKAALARIRSRLTIFRAVEDFGKRYLKPVWNYDRARITEIHQAVFREDADIIGPALLQLDDIRLLMENKPIPGISGNEPQMSGLSKVIKLDDEEGYENSWQALDAFEEISGARRQVFYAVDHLFSTHDYGSVDPNAAKSRLSLFFNQVYGVTPREVTSLNDLPTGLRETVEAKAHDETRFQTVHLSREDKTTFVKPYQLVQIDLPLGYKCAALLAPGDNRYVAGEAYHYDPTDQRWTAFGGNHDWDVSEAAMAMESLG